MSYLCGNFVTESVSDLRRDDIKGLFFFCLAKSKERLWLRSCVVTESGATRETLETIGQQDAGILMCCLTSSTTGRRTRRGEAAWAFSSPSRALMRMSVHTKRRRRASESDKVCWAKFLIKNQHAANVCESSWERDTPCTVNISHLFFLLLSVSPESALQWSNSFEELLKHSGQFVSPELISKPVKSAVQNSFPPPKYFFFFLSEWYTDKPCRGALNS